MTDRLNQIQDREEKNTWIAALPTKEKDQLLAELKLQTEHKTN